MKRGLGSSDFGLLFGFFPERFVAWKFKIGYTKRKRRPVL
jgi:hypothetical protein